jgi:hypothetical protein
VHVEQLAQKSNKTVGARALSPAWEGGGGGPCSLLSKRGGGGVGTLSPTQVLGQWAQHSMTGGCWADQPTQCSCLRMRVNTAPRTVGQTGLILLG